MRIHRVVVLAIATIVSIDVSVAAQRTFVSVNGSDTAACSVSAPCRSFGAAIAQTDAGGEIIVQDSGGYGKVTINKSVAIRSPAGIYAGISVLPGSISGVVVDVPGGRVVLEGLTITGLGAGNGILFLNGSELRVARVQIQGMPGDGILMYESSGGALIVTDSGFFGNTFIGIELAGGGSGSSVVVERCRFEGNGISGLRIRDRTAAHVRDSTFYRNFRGLEAVADLLGASIDVENAMIAENVVGLYAQRLDIGLAQIRVARSSIVGNTLFAIETQAASSIISRGDNTLADNAGGEAFTGTYLPK